VNRKISNLWRKWLTKREIPDRDALIVHYLYLVKWVVGRLGSAFPSHVKLEDLYSFGVTGLIRAVERFDPNKKSKFESYAILLIKGAIIDELRKLDWIPRSIHQKTQNIARAQMQLQQKLGRDPTDFELSEHLGITLREFKEILTSIRPAVLVPLNAQDENDEAGGTMADRIPDQNCEISSEIVYRKEFISVLEKAIASLPEQEKKVLMLYYYEELMLKEIGKILGISESRVSQIHTKALLKLRTHLKSYEAPSF
jgi:RNA polymerase sigma factor FliA